MFAGFMLSYETTIDIFLQNMKVPQSSKKHRARGESKSSSNNNINNNNNNSGGHPS
jgi:hypothetical protein